ncbi:MAG: hypothetical protein O2912_03220 [Proteobacteria bacterium]|nr:hypothetical protein [Pseudomonadota bacterium]
MTSEPKPNDKVVELIGSKTKPGTLKVNVSAELPYESAIEILRIVRDGEAKVKAALERKAKSEKTTRRKAEAAAAKATRAEAMQAGKTAHAAKPSQIKGSSKT